MDALMHFTGYLLSVAAAGGIVVGIEALNERCPDGPTPRRRVPAPVLAELASRHSARLRQDRS